jgi:hypothetical protein
MMTALVAGLVAHATLAVPAYAGNEGSGGGNAVVARIFVYQAYLLAQDFKQLPPGRLPDWFSAATFDTAVKNVKVYGVDAIDGQSGEQGVYLNARFYPEEKTIRVKWQDLEHMSRDEVRSLAMHEYLGVLWKETDGHYERSTELLGVLNGVLPPGATGGIDWDHPPIVCEDDQDFIPGTYKTSRQYRSELKLADGATDEDRLALDLLEDDVPAVRARLAKGLSANATLEDCGFDKDPVTHAVTFKHGCNQPKIDLLSYAARSDDSAEMIQLLLDAHADPNPAGSKRPPILEALRSVWQTYAVVKLLVDHGARLTDPSGKIDIGLMMRLVPTDEDSPELMCPMMSKVKLFQKHGYDINDPRMPAAVQLAANMNEPMLRMFHQLGARFDVPIPGLPEPYSNLTTYNGMTTLHALAIIDKSDRHNYNKVSTARYLVENGANPAAKDTRGLTALDRSWKYWTDSKCADSGKELDTHCMAERALIEYLTQVTPRS